MDVLRSLPGAIQKVIPLVCITILTFLPCTLPPLEAQENTQPPDIEEIPVPSYLEEEARPELFSSSLGDSDISLFLSGFWKGTLSGNWGLSKSPLGLTAASTDSPILFTQEADLTLSLWMRQRWFVEGTFVDDYSMNTYRAGYQGLPGETVQYIGIGNTGLDYPVFPYLDLGGNSSSSFGVYGRFGSGDFTFHGLVRYDAAQREERVFVGTRERTYTDISPEYPLRGRFFILPDEDIDTVPVVYIEDSDGSLFGGGRRWRRANPSEYAVSARYGQVELSSQPQGMVAVSYSKTGSSYLSSMGGYNPSSGFLGQVQQFFSQSGAGIELRNYPQPGGEYSGGAVPGTVSIGSVSALVIYEPGTFSPFESMSRYQAPSSAATSASLVESSTGNRISGYSLNSLDDLTDEPGLTLVDTPVSRGIFELARDAAGSDRRLPEKRWPLGAKYPGLYLPGNRNHSEDILIRFTNYGSSGAYSLGTDVVPGSVQVYREGLEDPRISFNEDTGFVTLETPAGFNEVIRITYLKQSDQRREGSLAAGLAAVYDPQGPFSTGLSVGLRWNLSSDAFSEEDVSSPGTVGLSGVAAWDDENLKAKVTLGLGFEQPDTTGLYRVSGMEGSETVWDYPFSEAVISPVPSTLSGSLSEANRGNLTYRNYRDTNWTGSSSLRPIEWSGASVVSDKNAPYPARDDSIGSDTLVGEFSLDGSKTWTGYQVPLTGIDELMETTQEIQVPFRLYNFSATPGTQFKIIVQFGPLRDDDTWLGENSGLIVERELFAGTNTALPEGWQLGRVILSEEDQQKLQEARAVRIVILAGGAVIQGRVLTAPLIILGSQFRPVVVDTYDGEVSSAPGTASQYVTAQEAIDHSLRDKYTSSIDRLHPDGAKQRVLKVEWDGLNSNESPGTDGRTGTFPFSSYKKLRFFVKAPDSGVGSGRNNMKFRFFVGKSPAGLKSSGSAYLDAEIPLSALPAGEWTRVEIHYGKGDLSVSVDGQDVPGARVSYSSPPVGFDESSEGSKTMYVAALVVPDSGTALNASSFSIDEITLEDPVPAYRGNLGGALSWSKPGTVLEVRGNPVVTDMAAETVLESGVRGNPADSSVQTTGAVQNRSRMEATVLGARITGDFRINAGTSSQAWNAGHGISRRFGVFGFSEEFSVGPEDENLRHKFAMDISSQFRGILESEVNYEDEDLERRWKLGTGVTFVPGKGSGLSLDIDARWTDRTDDPKDWLQGYGSSWTRSWAEMVPDAGEGVRRREARGLFKATADFEPVGAVLSMEASTNSSRIQDTTISESSGKLDFPFRFGNYQGSFLMERSFRQDAAENGTGIQDDLTVFRDSLISAAPLWAAVPFYSLFNSGLGGTITDLTEDSDRTVDSNRFTDRVSLSLRIPEKRGALGLVIPNSFQAGIDRILHQKLDTLSDILKVTGNLRFSGVNMFGAFGTNPLFSFYSTDEFSHSLETAVSIPRNEDILWRVQAGQNMGFYGFSGAELLVSNVFTVTNSGWSETATIDWIVPTRNSLLSVCYNFLMNKARGADNWPALSDLARKDYEQLRKETLELLLDNTGDYFTMSFIAGHESIIRIFGQLNFSVFAKLNTSYNADTEILSFIGTIGTTLNISF
ncbi:hypothetical protein [Breznakiella homolactica]|uniref:Uncharacterized protein n=1 Tax=Breznakiella homolactica TaxID=2798577 RepID=A0A7T7XL08_9SPIR|nr:hypothetical protein [Breznakiella homolactica]QQO08213.1 hypothetical protein JFL75_14910 [Breznakiella homolactica]